MSAETGSGIGMGGVSGVGGIATGGGIGIAVGRLGGGVGLEGGSIGIGSLGPSAATGIAEIGTAPSLGASLNSVVGVETPSAPFTEFSLDTSIPASEIPFNTSDYQVLWSANSKLETQLASVFPGASDNLTADAVDTFSEAENVDGMFADIGSFLNQSPAPAAETPEVIFKDIDSFLHQDATLPSGIDISIGETENSQDNSLSSVEKVSLAGLMTRIEHFAPATQEASSPSYDTPNEADRETSSDATAVQIEQISMIASEKRVGNVTSNPNSDTVMETTKTKPTTFDFVTRDIQQLNAGLDNAIADEIKQSDQIYATVARASEVQSVTNETATSSPEAAIFIDTGNTDAGGVIAPTAIVEQEIEADREQAARVLGIIEELKRDMDIADAPALATIAESITNKVASGVSGQAVPAEATPRPEPMVGQTYSEVQQEQTEEVAVSAEAESDAQAIADTRGTGTEEVIIVNAEDEEPDKKMKPPLPTSAELGQDHRKNQYRTDRIVEAVKEVKEDAEERFAKQGIIIDVTEVEGDAVADRLSYLQADDDAISEIVPEDEKDGSIAVLLHQMRDETFQTSADYDKAQILSLQNTAVKEGKPPATKPEIEKVLFIANQHNQQVAA